MRVYRSFKQSMRSGKAKVAASFENPNICFGVTGIIGAAIILLTMVLGLQICEQVGSLEPFLQQWKQAIESKKPLLYQQLWDSTARIKNRSQYERALKLLGSEKVEVDILGSFPQQEAKNENRQRIQRIPVTLYQDGKVFAVTYRDLTVEKQGILQRWKLIDDRARNESSHHETTKEHTAHDPEMVAQAANLTPKNAPSQPIDTPGPAINVTTSRTRTYAPDSNAPIAGEAPLDTQLKLSQVLGEWQQAWQGRNLKKYMSKYAEEAEVTRVTINKGREHPIRLNKKQLRQKMKSLNEKYSKIKVNIFQLKINGDTAVADVNFFQEFIATHNSGRQPIYLDFGKKELVFMVDPTDGLWKIYAENWKRYKNISRYPKL